MRRRKIEYPSAKLTAAGNAMMAMRVTAGLRNGSHQTGTAPEIAMKAGALSPSKAASASCMCMAMM